MTCIPIYSKYIIRPTHNGASRRATAFPSITFKPCQLAGHIAAPSLSYWHPLQRNFSHALTAQNINWILSCRPCSIPISTACSPLPSSVWPTCRCQQLSCNRPPPWPPPPMAIPLPRRRLLHHFDYKAINLLQLPLGADVSSYAMPAVPAKHCFPAFIGVLLPCTLTSPHHSS